MNWIGAGVVVLAACLASPCPGRQSGLAKVAGAPMPVDGWASLAPPANPAWIGGPKSLIDTRPVVARSSGITVYARSHKLDDDWRADLRAGAPAAEPGLSDAAQWGVPGVRMPPVYTSPEQQRLMSVKTDALGLCGALGGYVQCPNMPP